MRGVESVARWFLEAVGLGGELQVDPWELARRWQFRVMPRPPHRRSTFEVRRTDVLWVDLDDDLDEQRRLLARELAAIAIELAGLDDADPDVLAAALLEPGMIGNDPAAPR